MERRSPGQIVAKPETGVWRITSVSAVTPARSRGQQPTELSGLPFGTPGINSSAQNRKISGSCGQKSAVCFRCRRSNSITSLVSGPARVDKISFSIIFCPAMEHRGVRVMRVKSAISRRALDL
jgi:hypothetical protein